MAEYGPFLLVALGAWGIALGVLIWLGALSAIEARPYFPLATKANRRPQALAAVFFTSGKFRRPCLPRSARRSLSFQIAGHFVPS